jgi:HEAT repeat protein
MSVSIERDGSLGRRDVLKLAGSALLGNAVCRLGLVTSVAATAVLVDLLPAYAQSDKKTIERKRSSQAFNGKTMFEWMTDLKDKDVSVRERAVAALKVYEEEARDAAPLIIKAMSDQDMSLRVNAIITLGFIGMSEKDRGEGINALKYRVVKDAQGIVRFQAAVALGRLGADAYDAVPSLILASQDIHCWEIRQAAMGALATAGWNPNGGFDPFAYRAAYRALKDKCVEVRLQAALTLIYFGKPGTPADQKAALSALQQVVRDREENKRVRMWARVAMMRIDDDKNPEKKYEKELPQISILLKDKDMGTRVHAARALAFMGDKAKSQIPELVEALDDKESQVVVQVLIALGAMKSAAERATSAIKRMLQHPDPAVKQAANNALNEIGEKQKQAP